jgi:hypothetical protein
LTQSRSQIEDLHPVAKGLKSRFEADWKKINRTGGVASTRKWQETGPVAAGSVHELLRGFDQEGWNEAIVDKNVLQARSPKTAKRLTLLIRGRLVTMGEELWRLVRDGKGDVATHAVLAAAVKHSRLLADFLDLVVREQYRLAWARLDRRGNRAARGGLTTKAGCVLYFSRFFP